MGFERLKFTKEWTNAADFPTVETDEVQVRADMQALHDESKNALNKLMDALEASAAAAKMGAFGPQGEESTIQDELDGLHKGMLDAGALPVGGSTDQVLAKSNGENYQTRWASIGEIIAALRGVAGGVASLNEEGTIPVAQISGLLREKIDAGLPWELIDTLDNTRDYSGEWKAPDVFGDGSVYDLGVYMIGGGGSGGAAVCKQPYAATGGASGCGKNFIVEKVMPGNTFSWVIGAGGKAKSVDNSASANNAAAGNAGGTTAFNGETADGGAGGYGGSFACRGASGGQGSDAIVSPTNGAALSAAAHFGCNETAVGVSSSEYGDEVYPGGLSQSSRLGQNQFDPMMVTLGAGGKAYSYNANARGAQPTVALDNGQAGAGSNAATGNAATGYGNGGGATAHYVSSGTVTVTSGAGSDGVILLYARKVVS